MVMVMCSLPVAVRIIDFDTKPLRKGRPEIDTYLRYLVEIEGSDLHLSADEIPMVRLHGEMMRIPDSSKLTPERVSNIIRQYGSERVIVNGSADWGVSDPVALPKVVAYMQDDGHDEDTIQRLVFGNANAIACDSRISYHPGCPAGASFPL